MEKLFKFRESLIPYLSNHTLYKLYPELNVYYPLNEVDEPIYYLGLHEDYVKSLESLVEYQYVTTDKVMVNPDTIVYTITNEPVKMSDSEIGNECYSIPNTHYYNYKTCTFSITIDERDINECISISSNLVEFIRILGYYEGCKFFVLNDNNDIVDVKQYKTIDVVEDEYYIVSDDNTYYKFTNTYRDIWSM